MISRSRSSMYTFSRGGAPGLRDEACPGDGVRPDVRRTARSLAGGLAGLVLAATLGLGLAGCQSVQTTKGGVVGVDRTQRMSPLVSEAQLREGAEQAYREEIGKERQKGAVNSDAAPDAARACDRGTPDPGDRRIPARRAGLALGGQCDPLGRRSTPGACRAARSRSTPA